MDISEADVMAKLTVLRPTLGTLPPRIGPAPGDERDRNRYRSTKEPWRARYQSARWKRLRLRIFARDLFTCTECHRMDADTSRLICDHITPHKGDEVMFWDEANLQTMCKPCHDTVKQRMERGRR
jgi:5-methylcytosine-specific restriction protein A